MADRPARTLLEQRIRERCLTFEEFVQHAEAFARDHDEPGTLSLRHLQRLVSGREPDTLRPATARLLERLLDEPIAALLAPPPTTSSQDAGRHRHMDLPLAAEAEDSIVVPARTHDGKVVFVTLPRRLFVGSLGAAALVGMADARSGHQLVRIPESAGASVIDVDPVEHFQQIKKTLMDNDNLFGAGSVVQSTQEQISTVQRLRQSYRGAGRQKLLQVQTQLADLDPNRWKQRCLVVTAAIVACIWRGKRSPTWVRSRNEISCCFEVTTEPVTSADADLCVFVNSFRRLTVMRSRLAQSVSRHWSLAPRLDPGVLLESWSLWIQH